MNNICRQKDLALAQSCKAAVLSAIRLNYALLPKTRLGEGTTDMLPVVILPQNLTQMFLHHFQILLYHSCETPPCLE